MSGPARQLRRLVAPAMALVVAGCATPPPPLQPVLHHYARPADRPLRAFVFSGVRPTDGPRAAILLLHGGGWVAGSPEWTFDAARDFAAQGLVAIAVEYRLANETATPLDALADTCAALAWIRGRHAELQVDPQRVAAYGVSAGGQLAAAAGVRGCPGGGATGNGGPDALLLWSAALNTERSGWFRQLLRGQAEPADLSPTGRDYAYRRPTVIIHGAADTLTPLAGAQTFCARAAGVNARCELHTYPGLGHLLTRNLQDQEKDFDVDPRARADGREKMKSFLRSIGFASPQ